MAYRCIACGLGYFSFHLQYLLNLFYVWLGSGSGIKALEVV